MKNKEQPSDKELEDLLTNKDKKQYVAGLIRGDPVTCARYLDFRFDLFFKLILDDPSIAGDIVDHFRIIEVQKRGTKHMHCFLHDSQAPRFNVQSDQEICDYVDRYVTCDSTALPEDMACHHRHTHRPTCGLKWLKDKCRFGAPWWPCRITTIIRRIVDTDTLISAQEYKARKTLGEKINCFLNAYMRNPAAYAKDLPPGSSFDDFLKYLDLSEVQYMNILRVMVKRDIVSVKRSLSDINMNTFSRKGAAIWGSNNDMQFILNPYAAASYLTCYITKTDDSLSDMLKSICNKASDKNVSVRTTIKELGASILHETEVAAQQAVDIVGGIPLCRDSRSYVYIHTVPPCERARSIKQAHQVYNPTNDSTDVFHASLQTRYDTRPDDLRKVNLADFACEYTYNSMENSYRLKQGQRRILRYRTIGGTTRLMIPIITVVRMCCYSFHTTMRQHYL